MKPTSGGGEGIVYDNPNVEKLHFPPSRVDGALGPATWGERWQGLATEYGLLLPLSLVSVVALGAGAWLQATRAALPAEYTWVQPFATLLGVYGQPGVPLGLAVAATLGALARGDGENVHRLVAPWRTWFHPPVRQAAMLRLLVGTALAAGDSVLCPRHGLPDALALLLIGSVLAKPWWRWRRLGIHLLGAALVFTAVCYWFTTVKALVFVGRPRVDLSIIDFEHWLTGGSPHRQLAAWAAKHATWVACFDWAYAHLFHQMALTTAFMLALGNSRQRTEFFAAMSLCYLLGAPLYMLCPAMGPVYFEPQTFAFLHSQRLSTNWLQAVLLQNTYAVNAGRANVLVTWAYIACMPSLHMAHGLVMAFAVRASRIASFVALSFLGLSMVGVVALGWHYPTDVVFGLLLGAVAIALARWAATWLRGS